MIPSQRKLPPNIHIPTVSRGLGLVHPLGSFHWVKCITWLVLCSFWGPLSVQVSVQCMELSEPSSTGSRRLTTCRGISSELQPASHTKHPVQVAPCRSTQSFLGTTDTIFNLTSERRPYGKFWRGVELEEPLRQSSLPLLLQAPRVSSTTVFGVFLPCTFFSLCIRLLISGLSMPGHLFTPLSLIIFGVHLSPAEARCILPGLCPIVVHLWPYIPMLAFVQHSSPSLRPVLSQLISMPCTLRKPQFTCLSTGLPNAVGARLYHTQGCLFPERQPPFSVGRKCDVQKQAWLCCSPTVPW